MKNIEYCDRVRILSGKFVGQRGIVSGPVHSGDKTPFWVQVFPDSDPDSKKGKMEVVSLWAYQMNRLTNRCAQCDSVAPETDYLCKSCRQ